MLDASQCQNPKRQSLEQMIEKELTKKMRDLEMAQIHLAHWTQGFLSTGSGMGKVKVNVLGF